MNVRQIRSGWCWFGATSLALLAFLLVLAAIAVSAGPGWSTPGLVLLVLAGTSLVLMTLLVSLAFRIERRRTPD